MTEERPPKLKIWLAELRAPFFTASLVPVLLGAAFAYEAEGVFDPLLFVLTLAGVVFAHAGTNVVNDYFDFKSGTDMANKNRTPFNGGSPFLITGLLTPKEVYWGAMTFFALCAAIGFYLSYAVTYWIVPLGLIGIGLGYFYTSPRLNLAALGVGEFAVGLGFGPLVVAGAYMVQTGDLSAAALLAGLPVAFLIGLVLFINQFPDMEADGSVGKNHWVVRMGLRKASYWYAGLVAATFVTVAALWAAGVYPAWSLVALAPAVIGVKAIRTVLGKYASFRELVPAQAMTVQMHLTVGLLISAGLVAAGLL
ncbi:MAG: prenyltransferase [Candidatus Thermoplasmatota archaeon]